MNIHPRIKQIVDALERDIDDDGVGVIPIVGQGLLQVDGSEPALASLARADLPPGSVQLLEEELSEIEFPIDLQRLISRVFTRLVGRAVLAGNGFGSLSEIVSQHPLFDANRFQVDTDVGQIYTALAPKIPKALRCLATIRRFGLFISTTPDDLLERAINDERFDGEPLTRVLAFSPNRRPTDEKIAGALNSGYPVVFHLFGRYKNPGNVALTDSDFVDYMAALLDGAKRPGRLFEELKSNHLLMLGNSFHDWLARFFLRLARDTPLGEQPGGVQYIADEEFGRDESFALFCRRCAKKAEPIEDVDPATFVSQLAQTWSERVHARQNARSRRELGPDKVSSDTIFVSYSRSDLGGGPSADIDRATRLANDLKKEGWKVWLDTKGGLRPGDEYEREIENAILRCGIFLPVCSKITQMRPDSDAERPFFRKEWLWALERAETIKEEEPGRKFILPVVVDDLPFSRSNVPAAFKTLNANQLSEGTTTEEFRNEVQRLVRDIRRRERAA